MDQRFSQSSCHQPRKCWSPINYEAIWGTRGDGNSRGGREKGREEEEEEEEEEEKRKKKKEREKKKERKERKEKKKEEKGFNANTELDHLNEDLHIDAGEVVGEESEREWEERRYCFLFFFFFFFFS